jgi:isoleucyl-tRNA synthetase
MAPFMPFMAEQVYELLRVTPETQAVDSVHLRDLPERRELSTEEYQVEHRIDLTRTICELGRSLREKARIRTRQPLSVVKVGTTSSKDREWLKAGEDVILEELNIKKLEILDDPTKLATPTVKPNMPRLGPRLGKQVKSLATTLTTLQDIDAEKVRQLASGESTEVDGVQLDPEDVHVEMQPSEEGELVATSGRLVVTIDTHITDELRREGLARDLVNRIQKMRKDADMKVDDRIDVSVVTDSSDIRAAVEQNHDLIAGETLVRDKIELGTPIANVEMEKSDKIEGEDVTIQIGRGA